MIQFLYLYQERVDNMSKIEQFIESIDVVNTAKVVKHVLNDINIDFENCDASEIENFILSLHPNSPKAIVTICYVLSLYARWLEKNQLGNGTELYALIGLLDKDQLWKKAKPLAARKFISHQLFSRVICDIGLYEEFNKLYYQTLFRCVYEGIYNDDMSVLKNLRGSDVHGNIVTLHEDNGNTYDFAISSDLANAIIELSEVTIWERKNRNGICRVNTRWLYPDSVFKIEERKSAAKDGEKHKFSLYSKLRKITDEYMDYRILPFQIYISGITHRIKIALNENNISLEDAICGNMRNSAQPIILHELKRSNYTSDINNFREIIKGHLELF